MRATDAAGNPGLATRDFEVDSTGPDAPDLTATSPASPANENSPLIKGTATASTTIHIYTGANCQGSPAVSGTDAELEAGIEVSVGDDTTTTFRATATTAANNTSGCSEPITYVEDSSPPTTQITGNPPISTNSSSANFDFSGTDAGGSGVASLPVPARLDAGGGLGDMLLTEEPVLAQRRVPHLRSAGDRPGG